MGVAYRTNVALFSGAYCRTPFFDTSTVPLKNQRYLVELGSYTHTSIGIILLINVGFSLKKRDNNMEECLEYRVLNKTSFR